MEGEGKLTFEGDPVEAIDGLLSNINLESIELQHKAVEVWRAKVLKSYT